MRDLDFYRCSSRECPKCPVGFFHNVREGEVISFSKLDAFNLCNVNGDLNIRDWMYATPTEMILPRELL